MGNFLQIPVLCFSSKPLYFCFLESSYLSSISVTLMLTLALSPTKLPESVKVMSKKPLKKGAFIDVEALDDEDICVDYLYNINCIGSVYCIV